MYFITELYDMETNQKYDYNSLKVYILRVFAIAQETKVQFQVKLYQRLKKKGGTWCRLA